MNSAPEEITNVASLFSAIFHNSVLPKQRILADEAEKKHNERTKDVPACCKNKLIQK